MAAFCSTGKTGSGSGKAVAYFAETKLVAILQGDISSHDF